MKKVFSSLLCVFSILILSGCSSGNPAPAEPTPSVPPTIEFASPTPEIETKPEPTQTETIDDRVQLIFSHDGAADDITTLAYIVKHPGIKLLGVVNSYGEQHPSRSSDKWARYLYDVIDLDEVPMGIGSETSLDPAQKEFPAAWRESADNFLEVPLPEGSEDYTYENGTDLIINLVRGSAQPVTILITGAQTDMALALRKDPGIAENIKRIVIMGGAFNVGGNLGGQPGTSNNKVAEWNIFVDALAANEVFNSGIPLSVISLDGSDNFIITQNDIIQIQGSEDPLVKLISELWKNNSMIWGGDFKIWDIVAAVAVTNPELISWNDYYLDVVVEPGGAYGQTISLEANPFLSGYSASTDFDGVKNQVFDILLEETE